jgi:hypothetical protein
MKKTFNVLIVVLVAFTLSALAMTTVTGQRIINSLIDSTPIGNTTPSTGKFTSVTATSVGAATGGFGLVEAGNQYSGGSLVNGNWLAWNQTLAGESDFVNQHAGGSGGWGWYDTTSGASIGTNVATLSRTGVFSVGTVNSTTFNGNLNGNATSANTAGSAGSANTANSAGSANVLNSPVFNCGATTPATGIQTNGNANCGAYPNRLSSNGFSTLPGGLIMQWGNSGTFDTGPVTVGLPTTFPHACLQAVVGDASSGSRIESVVSCSQSTISIRNDGSGAATYYVIGY